MTFEEYQKVKGVNWSTLKEMRKSPLHYKHALEHPRKDTPRLALGRATHTAILEPDRFLLEYACFKGPIRRGKKWDAFKEAHPTETILKQEEYALCLAMRDAVRNSAPAMAYLKDGRSEVPVSWTDETTSLTCKGRMDWLSTSRTAIVDIKTTQDVDPQRFASLCARMLYHCQAAFYQEGAKRVTGKALPVVLIAVEAAPPHDVVPYVLDDDATYAGWEVCAGLLERVKECRESGKWPGRYEEEQTLRMPAWIWDDNEDDTSTDGLDLDWSTANGGG